MIVDDSFNYHSLSLTIMFAIKRSMIVHDSLSKSRNVLASLTGTKSPTACDCKQIVRKTSDHTKTTLTINRRLVTILSYLKGNFADIYLSMLINAKCWSEIKVKARLELLVVCDDAKFYHVYS